MSATAPVVTGGSCIPVVFHDGETETDVGVIVVSPSLTFKAFQSFIADRIGISPNQFTAYLCDGKLRGPKILITGKFNFSTTPRYTNCYFLIVLKRSRRSRRRKPHAIINRQFQIPTPNMMLLMRDGNSIALNNCGYFEAFESGRVEYERRVRELQMERERYLTSINRNREVFCQECERGKETGVDVGFHWCVYDAVTVGFRSMAGPIARPGRRTDCTPH